MTALPENPPKIDWAYYKTKIPVPAMVDEFQKKYESFKIPLPEDNITATIATEEKAAVSLIYFNITLEITLLQDPRNLAPTIWEVKM